MMSEAMAPAFVLGAIAGFISILLGRLTAVVDRIRSLNDIAEDDHSRGHLKADLPRLRRRAELLSSAAHLAIFGGMCVGLLLIAGFACAYLRLEHTYGTGILFVVGIALLVAALFRFGQEVRIGLIEPTIIAERRGAGVELMPFDATKLREQRTVILPPSPPERGGGPRRIVINIEIVDR
jgi:hypothetical protein